MLRSLRDTITFKQVIALVIIFMIDLGGFLVGSYVNHEQDGLALLINMSGRQRMLSQRIPLLLHQKFSIDGNQEIISKDLKEKVALFKNSHEKLRAAAIIRDKDGKDLGPYYQAEQGLNYKTEYFLTQVEKIQANLDPQKREKDLIQLTTFSKYEFLKKLDGAVKLFENYSSRLTRLRNRVEITLLIVNTIAHVLVFFIIFRPLTKLIKTREAELKIARKKAEEESAFKTMFLANMSHELRTPLNGVLGTADLMGSTQLDQEQQEYLEIINQSGKILLGVINNILDLTKLQAGAVELEEVTFCPETLLYGVPKSFRYPLESRGLHFKVECIDLPKALKGDTVRLSQILNNIVGNAVKFTEEGGITLKANYTQDTLHISIADTGIGMTQEAASKIFESFVQADASTTRRFGGTGLGLSITKELVGVMGGEIEVQSEVGKGTTFLISLPFPLGDPSDIENNIKSNIYDETNLDSKGKKVLVDDNDINRKLMTRILDRFNIVAVEAHSGFACLEVLKNTKVDLILMDYHMPGMNGIETAEKVIEKFEKAPPIVALTADVVEDTRLKIKEAGMKELIPKPVQRADLKRILSTYLQIEIE